MGGTLERLGRIVTPEMHPADGTPHPGFAGGRHAL